MPVTIPINTASYQRDRPHALTSASPLQETTSLLPHPIVSIRKNWMNATLVVAGIYTMVIIWKSFGNTMRIEGVVQPQDLSRWAPYTTPPENIYELPMNESCQEKYLDQTSNNLCKTNQDLCLDTYNCPREAMVQFNPHATLEGFLSWLGGGSYEYISSKSVKICQREIFKNKVDYDISLQKNPIPGESVPCGEEGRTYLIDAEGCVIDGNHGVIACKVLNMPIKVIRVDSSFFPLVEKVKNYINGCWKRVLSAKICHQTMGALYSSRLIDALSNG